jgi:hypothetical protein
MACLLLDLLEDLPAFFRVDQVFRARRGDRPALDFVARQVELLRLVADPARSIGCTNDEKAAELEQVDRLLTIA